MNYYDEIWKPINDYNDNYYVSSLGRVKSLKGVKDRILKQHENTNGYLIVKLCKYGVCKTRKVHQLVAMAFLNHTPDGMNLVINHINTNKLDNNISNLEITTNRQNSNKKHIKSHSEYVGVTWYKRYSKWASKIHINGKSVHLGYFNNEIDAANAYLEKLNTL